jgi:hypothetical protein
MDDFCCQNAGGRVALTIDGPMGAKQFNLRGSVTIMPTNTETEAHAHSHGGMYVTTKAVPATAEITLSDSCGLRMEDLLGCTIQATIRLIDQRTTYYYSNSRVVGRPSIKTEDGEISGLKIASGRVSRVVN